jgi:hypothetical protein
VNKKLLHVFTKKLEQVVISIETFLDLNMLSIKEVIDHMRSVEQCKKPSPTKDNGGRLLLAEEEWTVWMKSMMAPISTLAPIVAA